MSNITSPLQKALLTVDHLKTQMRTVLKLHMERNELTLANLATAIGSTSARANRMLMPHSQHEVSLQAYVTAIAALGMDIDMKVEAKGAAGISIRPPASKITAAALAIKPHPDIARKADLTAGAQVLMAHSTLDALNPPQLATVATVGRIYIDVLPTGTTPSKPIKFDGRTMLATHGDTQYLLLLPDNLKVNGNPPADIATGIDGNIGNDAPPVDVPGTTEPEAAAGPAAESQPDQEAVVDVRSADSQGPTESDRVLIHTPQGEAPAQEAANDDSGASTTAA